MASDEVYARPAVESPIPGTVGPAVYRLAPLGACCLFLLRDDEVQRWD